MVKLEKQLAEKCLLENGPIGVIRSDDVHVGSKYSLSNWPLGAIRFIEVHLKFSISDKLSIHMIVTNVLGQYMHQGLVNVFHNSVIFFLHMQVHIGNFS